MLEKEENSNKRLKEGKLTEKSMFFLSWLTALGSGTDSVCLITLTDSPENKVIKEVREGQRSMCIFVCIGRPDIVNQRLTSEDRLVHTQSCGADGGDSDISRDFVTNYTGKS